MLLAKIIKSNSHVDYAARILDSFEASEALKPEDYGFAQFVKVTVGGGEAIGVIYNSQLINPEFGNYGPRLSTPPELNSVFSPDYLNEQGVMIGVLLLGWRDGNGSQQGVPRSVLPINSQVETMTAEEVRAFHQNKSGALQLGYYSHVTTHAGDFGFQLLAAIADQLDELLDERDRARLCVLRRTLSWQQTVGGIK
ncbi:MAG TPA: hypothetical protein PLK30_18110 [Blastocatellia bacterium]|nr:hypothetical protein [Blastocatellia bacterium]